MADFAYKTALELVDGYKKKSFSPVEVAKEILDRIERLNDSVNAFYWQDVESAIKEAKRSEERWIRNAPLSAIDGVPVSVKDQVYLKGAPSPLGTKLLGADPVAFDAPSSVRLKASGAIIVGKTTMPELGVSGVTQSGDYGITRNPWNMGVTPGGSSGGASAALAAGLAPLAVGTDGAGSIRIPCSFTNTFGLKPTLGRIPHYPSPNDRTVVGPMARTVNDAALLMNVLAKWDSRDIFALPDDNQDYLVKNSQHIIKGMKIAYSPKFGGADRDPEVAGCMESAVEVLRNLGASVSEIDQVCGSTFEWWLNIAGPRYALLLKNKDISRLSEAVQEIVRWGQNVTAENIAAAFEDRLKLYAAVDAIFNQYDAIVTCVSPYKPFKIGQFYPKGNTLNGGDGFSFLSCTTPFSITQHPAGSVPAGFSSDGLPIGLQVVTKKYADSLIFRICKAFELETMHWKRTPKISGKAVFQRECRSLRPTSHPGDLCTSHRCLK